MHLAIYTNYYELRKNVKFLVFASYKELYQATLLKAVDTIGNCQLNFTVGVSQHMHKITNMLKFELNWSLKLRDNNERKKQPCHTKLCAFRCKLISRPHLILRSQNQVRGKLLVSRKLCYNVLYYQPLPITTVTK